MESLLKGKVILVTGGARGIGRACVELLAEQGASLIIHYNQSEKEALEIAEKITSQGGSAKTFQADLSRSSDINGLFKFIEGAYGTLDALVNNAGIMKPNLIPMVSEKELGQLFNININGLFLCMQKASRMMMRKGKGTIINVSSVVGRYGSSGLTAYASTKGAVLAMTYSAAKELGSFGITVNAIAPGLIETDMIHLLDERKRKDIIENKIALHRIGTPKDVAGVVLFLCTDWASYVNGQVIGVDGCYSM